MGAVAAFRLVAQVKALPRTRCVTMMMGRVMTVTMMLGRVRMRMVMTMRMGKSLVNVIAFGLANLVNTCPKLYQTKVVEVFLIFSKPDHLCFRSGKTARKTIADLADGKAVKIPPTIEDPTVYKGVKEALQIIGYALDAPDPVL